MWILLICCWLVFAQEIKVKRFQRTVSLLEVADLRTALLQGGVNGGGIVCRFHHAAAVHLLGTQSGQRLRRQRRFDGKAHDTGLRA